MKVAPTDKVIYTNLKGEDLINLRKFKGTTEIVPIDEDLNNQFRLALVKKLNTWKQKKAIEEYSMIPENLERIRAAMQLGLVSLGYAAFTLKEFVNVVGCKYTEAEDLLDMMFATSLCAFDDSGDVRMFTILPDKVAKLGYIISQRDKRAKELEDIDNLILLMESDISESEQVSINENQESEKIEVSSDKNLNETTELQS
ncbi:MAG: hypothetical protein A3F91_03415 [Flavobacteria bacterium RIFCSPLOWO2_12_FULL_35_11]|nr:MAG: hypothetical protein A3F91_03415 [Flavobacteria bacterium RIFCSPLOWO2_12_FULL_35_11]